MFGAQDLYIAINVFPFYAYTLCCLVPRCCRVSLQPGLAGHNSISFFGLQGVQTLVLKPDNSDSSRFKHYFLLFYGVFACFAGFIGTKANGGTANRQELLQLRFLIKRLSFDYAWVAPSENLEMLKYLKYRDVQPNPCTQTNIHPFFIIKI